MKKSLSNQQLQPFHWADNLETLMNRSLILNLAIVFFM